MWINLITRSLFSKMSDDRNLDIGWMCFNLSGVLTDILSAERFKCRLAQIEFLYSSPVFPIGQQGKGRPKHSDALLKALYFTRSQMWNFVILGIYHLLERESGCRWNWLRTRNSGRAWAPASKQACKPRSYASSKLMGVKCRATSVAKNISFCFTQNGCHF